MPQPPKKVQVFIERAPNGTLTITIGPETFYDIQDGQLGPSQNLTQLVANMNLARAIQSNGNPQVAFHPQSGEFKNAVNGTGLNGMEGRDGRYYLSAAIDRGDDWEFQFAPSKNSPPSDTFTIQKSAFDGESFVEPSRLILDNLASFIRLERMEFPLSAQSIAKINGKEFWSR